MGLSLDYLEGQTPLAEEEKTGLLFPSILTQGDLNEHEQLNIEKAVEWLIRNKPRSQKILTEEFLKQLHKKMFCDVWKWAGEFRKTEKNIGVKWIKIKTELKKLLDDTNYWIENKTYSPDEIAIRFKHRLVNIHCFSNGNGRHSRLMADIIVESIFQQKIFSWNASSLKNSDTVRKKYISALQDADKGNIKPLIKFARG